MTANKSIVEPQQLRSFSEIITVYKKLAKFYSYNFFLKNGSYLASFVYLISIVIPLPVLLVKIRRTPTNYLFGNPVVLASKNQLFKYAIECLFSKRRTFFYFFHNFLSRITISHVAKNLCFLQRRTGSVVNPQEEMIISSVNKIRTYDIPFFEFAVVFLLQFLHFALVLGLVFLIRFSSYEEDRLSEFIPYFCWRFFLQYFAILSPSLLTQLIVSLGENFEFIIFFSSLLLLQGVPTFYIRTIRVLLLIFCLLKVLFENYSKIKDFRK